MSLRLRLALIFAAVSALALAFGGAMFVHQLGADVRGTADARLLSRATAIANSLATPGSDPVAVLEAKRPVLRASPRSDAQILDRDGRVLASVGVRNVPMITSEAASAAGVEPTFSSSGPDKAQRFVVVGVDRSGVRLVIVVHSDLQSGEEAIDRVGELLILGGVPLVLLAGVAGWLIARAALRPVERLRAQVAQMSDEEVGPDLDVSGANDEIAALAITMNDLLARVRGARRRERRFVAEAGHELRTPLTILQGELELAERPGRSADDLRETLRIAREESMRLARLAEDLLLLARSDSGELDLHLRPVDPAEVVERSIVGFTQRFADRAVDVAFERSVPSMFDVDPDRFRQAVDNLLDNALRHAPDDSTVEVVVEAVGTGFACVVRDRGSGFPADVVDRALDRFARSSMDRHDGAGLGLSIVRAVAETHGGSAWVANRPGGGAEAGLVLPCVPRDGEGQPS